MAHDSCPHVSQPGIYSSDDDDDDDNKDDDDDDDDDDDRLISGVEDPCSRPRGVPGGQEEGHLCWTRQGGICQVRFISDLLRCISSAYQV